MIPSILDPELDSTRKAYNKGKPKKKIPLFYPLFVFVLWVAVAAVAAVGLIIDCGHMVR
jgi:hypothetical protein